VVHIISNHLPNAGIENFEAQLSSYFFHRLECQINLFSAHFYPEIDGEFGASVSQMAQFSSYLSYLKSSPSCLPQSLISLLEDEFLKKFSEMVEAIRVDCSHCFDGLLSLEPILYYMNYFHYIREKVPFFSEIIHRSIDFLNQLLQKNLLIRVNYFNHGITRLTTDEASLGQKELRPMKETLKYLHCAETMFPLFNVYSDSISCLQVLVNTRVEMMRTVDLQYLKKEIFLSNLRVSDKLKLMTEDVPESYCHITLREETLRFLASVLRNNLDDVNLVSISQFKASCFFIGSLAEFQFISPYEILDQITEDVQSFGKKFYELKEENLNSSFHVIQATWRPDGSSFVALPYEQFSASSIKMRNILADMKELLEDSDSYLPGICRTFLFEYPHRLFSLSISGKHSMIKSHVEEISTFLFNFNSDADLISGDLTDLIYHLFLLTRELSPFDKFLPDQLNYSELNQLCDVHLRKVSINMTASLQRSLEMNNLSSVKDILVNAQSNSALTIRESSDQMLKMLSELMKEKRNSVERMIKELHLDSLALESFQILLANGVILRDCNRALQEFLEPGVQDLLSETVEQLSEFVKSTLCTQLTKAESTDAFSQSMNHLSIFKDISDLVLSSHEPLFDLEELNHRRDEQKQKLLTLMAAAVGTYKSLPPRGYLKDSNHTPLALVNQLKQFRGPEYQSLISTLTENVVNKLLGILNQIKEKIDDIMFCESRLHYIDTIWTVLTPEMVDQISAFHHKCITSLDEAKLVQQRQILEAHDGDLLDGLVETFKKHCQNKHCHLIKQLKETIGRAIRQECAKFRKDMAQKNTLTLIATEPAAYESWKHYLKIAQDSKVQIQADTFWGRYLPVWNRYGGLDNVCLDRTIKPTISELQNEILTYIQSQLQEFISITPPCDGHLSFLQVLEKISPIISQINSMEHSSRLCEVNFFKYLEKQSRPPPSAVSVSYFRQTQSYLQIVLQKFLHSLQIQKDLQRVKEFMDKFKEFEKLICDLHNSHSSPEFESFIRSFPVYSDAVDLISMEFVKWRELLDQLFLGNAATNTVNSQDKDKFYDDLYASFCATKEIRGLANHINPNIYSLDQTISHFEDHIFCELSSFETASQQIEFPTKVLESYDRYNMCLENLRSFAIHFPESYLLMHKSC
jgi:succinate dehydrogenase flavin-adding protein (antitoxin of CptAB toxin-antitoxin module)